MFEGDREVCSRCYTAIDVTRSMLSDDRNVMPAKEIAIEVGAFSAVL